MNHKQNDWEEQTKSSLVSIGTHKLFLSVSGPVRKAGQPIVLVFPGSGDTVRSYPAVERLLAPFARILLYDRSGLGRSEDGPNRVNAVVAAEELHVALKATDIIPPYVLVGHSYGGVVAREFLHLYDAEVVGMVLVDAGTERQCQFFKIPDPNILALLGDMNFAQVSGLRADSKISREEWRARAAERPRGAASSIAEGAAFVEVCQMLAEKNQYAKQALSKRPLSVIRANGKSDCQKIYDRGAEVGNGTEEQRKAFRELLSTWDEVDKDLKEEQLQLSSNTHYVHLPDCGHNVQLIRPDVIANEIRWVLENLIGQGRAQSI